MAVLASSDPVRIVLEGSREGDDRVAHRLEDDRVWRVPTDRLAQGSMSRSRVAALRAARRPSSTLGPSDPRQASP